MRDTYPAIENSTLSVHVSVLHLSEKTGWVVVCGGLQECLQLYSDGRRGERKEGRKEGGRERERERERKEERWRGGEQSRKRLCMHTATCTSIVCVGPLEQIFLT